MDSTTWAKLRLPLTLAAVPVVILVSYNGSRAEGLEWVKETALTAVGMALLVWFGIGHLMRKAEPTRLAFGADARGLPVAEWQEETRRGGTVEYKAKVTRRCRIEIGPDGVPLFVHEVVEDETGKFLPLTVLLGAGGMQAAGKALAAQGIGVRSNAFVAPWVALGGFTLTTDAEHYGLRTKAGGPLNANQINHMVVADFGLEWGTVVVSDSAKGRALSVEIHRLLTRDFMLGRRGHLERLHGPPTGGTSSAIPTDV